MKKRFSFPRTIMLLAIFVGLNACGGGSKDEDKITLPDPPKDIKYLGVEQVDGPLAGYLEVVPGDYKLELKKDETKYLLGYRGSIKVKFRFLKSIDVKAGSGYNNFGPSLLGKALEDNGAPLEFNLDATADKDLATYLKRGSGEEWITLHISAQGTCKNAEEAAAQLENYQKGKKIRFNSEIIEEKFDSDGSSSTSSSSSSDDESEDNGGSNCEAFLSEYESFMKKYIAILKKFKANPQDLSIMSDYTSMASEAADWEKKTKDCVADAKFAAKFAAIQMKIAEATSGL